MYRKMLRSKIHRAVVTGADLDYEGSITIDAELLQEADIKEYQQVQIVNLASGVRFETYTISGGPGEVQLNGAAARLVQQGDRIIIMAYELVDQTRLPGWKPRIVLVNENNQVKEVLC